MYCLCILSFSALAYSVEIKPVCKFFTAINLIGSVTLSLLLFRVMCHSFSFNMLALQYKQCFISVAEHLDPINVKIAELKEALESVTAEQKYLKAREARHRHSKLIGLACALLKNNTSANKKKGP